MCESHVYYNGKRTGTGESHQKIMSQVTQMLCADGQLQYTSESIPIKGCSRSYITQQNVIKEMIRQISMSYRRGKRYFVIPGNRQKSLFLILSCTSQQVLAMGDKGAGNHSDVTDFILVGFRVRPELHILIFLLFPIPIILLPSQATILVSFIYIHLLMHLPLKHVKLFWTHVLS